MPSFRVQGKIFATVPDQRHLHVMLDSFMTDAAVGTDPVACEELWWGKQLSGVRITLAHVARSLLADLLEEAWLRRAPKRPAGRVRAPATTCAADVDSLAPSVAASGRGEEGMNAILAALLMVGLLAAQPARGQAAAPAKRIKFGIQTGQQDVTYQEVVAIWKEAEALGFDSAWNFDHFMPIRGDQDGPCLEAWTLLGALAAQTSRIRIGTLVNGNTYRNPALLAKMATTVDHISGGRFELGIGAAWFEPEHRAYGFPFYTAKERADRLGEALEVITKLWTEDHPSFEGQYYTLFKAPFSPRNVQTAASADRRRRQGEEVDHAAGGALRRRLERADRRDARRASRSGGRSSATSARASAARRATSRCQAFLVLYSITDVPFAGGAVRLGARLIEDKRVAAIGPGGLAQGDHRADPHLRRRGCDAHHHEHPAALRSRAAAPLRQGGHAELPLTPGAATLSRFADPPTAMTSANPASSDSRKTFGSGTAARSVLIATQTSPL